ncbi:MAG: IMP cyclohydrolase [Spirochaetales bacterium]|nr:IMP cyclohydrolase [Spirochaetales bacterium]
MANLKQMYATFQDDPFSEGLELTFSGNGRRQTLVFEKVTWEIDGERKGLRYGENPDQPAALYKMVNGNLTIGEVTSIVPGKYLASDIELVQSGKHPGKINITDADNALNILRYFTDTPCCVIVKHNNPSGVALGNDIEDAYRKALMADRVAAFGGAVALNRTVDLSLAKVINESYSEVVIAPDFSEEALALFEKKKNLRVMQIGNISSLETFIGERFIDIKSLIDGGLILQWSFVPKTLTPETLMPAHTEYKGQSYKIERTPSQREYDDMKFGWYVESGITSNSVIYVKDGVTVGIGTGEQDRVGVAEIARDKAYRKLADRICWERHRTPFALLEDTVQKEAVTALVQEMSGGMKGAVMVSDAFFPFRDGVEVGLKEGVTAVIQPGGSLRDFESIEACNEYGASMVYTGQRSFKH